MDKPIIFVSCGQRTEAEIQLGKDICALIEELTVYKPYFAEYQNSLEGVTANIFSALHS